MYQPFCNKPWLLLLPVSGVCIVDPVVIYLDPVDPLHVAIQHQGHHIHAQEEQLGMLRQEIRRLPREMRPSVPNWWHVWMCWWISFSMFPSPPLQQRELPDHRRRPSHHQFLFLRSTLISVSLALKDSQVSQVMSGLFSPNVSYILNLKRTPFLLTVLKLSIWFFYPLGRAEKWATAEW